jgi:hypothetical protein
LRRKDRYIGFVTLCLFIDSDEDSITVKKTSEKATARALTSWVHLSLHHALYSCLSKLL